MMPAQGIVRIQAHMIRRVTPQRTAVIRREAPTPEMAPVMTWVELTGIPHTAVRSRVSVAEASAEKPLKG